MKTIIVHKCSLRVCRNNELGQCKKLTIQYDEVNDKCMDYHIEHPIDPVAWAKRVWEK
jgi:hypothetical protein